MRQWIPTMPSSRGFCIVDSCKTRSAPGRKMCHFHRNRMNRGVSFDIPRRKYEIGKAVSYTVAHKRVKSHFGSAKQYPCVNCGGISRDWAYDGTDPTQILGTNHSSLRKRMSWYSRYPEYYMPMCQPCHNIRDGEASATELNTYRRMLATQKGWTVVE
jgi:hypothetical protein